MLRPRSAVIGFCQSRPKILPGHNCYRWPRRKEPGGPTTPSATYAELEARPTARTSFPPRIVNRIVRRQRVPSRLVVPLGLRMSSPSAGACALPARTGAIAPGSPRAKHLTFRPGNHLTGREHRGACLRPPRGPVPRRREAARSRLRRIQITRRPGSQNARSTCRRSWRFANGCARQSCPVRPRDWRS
jgi:hypothetical protein